MLALLSVKCTIVQRELAALCCKIFPRLKCSLKSAALPEAGPKSLEEFTQLTLTQALLVFQCSQAEPQSCIHLSNLKS